MKSLHQSRPMRPKELQLMVPKLSRFWSRRLLASHVRPMWEPSHGTPNMPFLRNESGFFSPASHASYASYVFLLNVREGGKCIDLKWHYMGRMGRTGRSLVVLALVLAIIALAVAWLLVSWQAWLLVPTDVDAYADAHTATYAAAHTSAHAAIAVCVSPAARGRVNWRQLYRPMAPLTSHLAHSEPGNTRVIRSQGARYQIQLHSTECARVLPGAFPFTGQRIARPGHIIELYHDLTAPFLRTK
jgi:hypothetical protein